VLLALIVSFAVTGTMSGEINMMIATLALGGFTCSEIGKHIPYLRSVGGAALVTIFLPSFLVEIHFFSASLFRLLQISPLRRILFIFLSRR